MEYPRRCSDRIRRNTSTRQTWITSMLNRTDVCRVCGLAQDEPPWGSDGKTPSFNICSCCGVEFGYEDATPAGTREYRRRWVGGGAKWFTPSRRPEDWCLEEQLRQVPTEYV